MPTQDLDELRAHVASDIDDAEAISEDIRNLRWIDADTPESPEQYEDVCRRLHDAKLRVEEIDHVLRSS